LFSFLVICSSMITLSFPSIYSHNHFFKDDNFASVLGSVSTLCTGQCNTDHHAPPPNHLHQP
jgi:hypothetical protein